LEALDIDDMIEEFNEEKDLSLDSRNGWSKKINKYSLNVYIIKK
jgi:hypothetical protein